jgi:hypothetical protein
VIGSVSEGTQGRIGVGVRRGGIEGDPRESPQLCLYVFCFRAWMTKVIERTSLCVK